MRHEFAIRETDFGIATSDSAVADAFSRLRVSAPVTLFESQTQYNANPLRMEPGATGAGVVPVWSSVNHMVLLQVNAGGAGGTSFLQSFQYIPYQPGKSQMILMTGVMGSGVAGAVKRYGYGDALNGIFYEQNGTTGLQFNRRTSTSGVAVDNPVTQANWNLDKFDGTGPSGAVLDPTKCFILIIDLQFLGMGRVRIGFDIDGVIRYAHEFLNANILAVPYMQTATLPILIEIIAAGALGGVATCYYKCSSVVSEGGYEFGLGRDFAVEGTATAASGARTHILSLRPTLLFPPVGGITNRGLFIAGAIECLAGTSPVYVEVCIGAAFTVAPAFANVNPTYSFMQAGTGGTFNNLTNGIVIGAFYVPSGAGNSRQIGGAEFVVSYPITLDRAGAVRALGTLSFLVTGIGGNSDSRLALNWRELR